MLVIEGGRWRHAIKSLFSGDQDFWETETFCKLLLTGQVTENSVTCGDCMAEMEREGVRFT